MRELRYNVVFYTLFKISLLNALLHHFQIYVQHTLDLPCLFGEKKMFIELHDKSNLNLH